MSYEVKVLQAGYARRVGAHEQRCDGTITLVKGRKNMIIDTGGPWDKDAIIKALAAEGLGTKDILFVVCTHGHSDHTGNNNLFACATFIVSYDICKGDLYTFHDFGSGKGYRIDEDIEVIPTPGHTGQDVSVVVRTGEGVVAIAGDLFECEEDLEDESLWRSSSLSPEEQKRSRARVLSMADFIVPGHGERFSVKK